MPESNDRYTSFNAIKTRSTRRKDQGAFIFQRIYSYNEEIRVEMSHQRRVFARFDNFNGCKRAQNGTIRAVRERVARVDGFSEYLWSRLNLFGWFFICLMHLRVIWCAFKKTRIGECSLYSSKVELRGQTCWCFPLLLRIIYDRLPFQQLELSVTYLM